MEDKDNQILTLLPCKVGEDFVDSCVAIGLGGYEGNLILGKLIDDGFVDVYGDSYVLTDKGNKALDDYRKKMAPEISNLETRAMTEKVMKEVIWTGGKTLVHPAQYFDDNRAYTSQFLIFPSEKSQIEKAVIITSAKEVFHIDKLPDYIQLQTLPYKSSSIWSYDSMREFLDGTVKSFDLKLLLHDVSSLYRTYIDFPDERYYSFISVWVIGTYFHQLFSSYPYVFINGTKQSGKTKILNLTSCIAFNGNSFIAPTSSSFFRIISSTKNTLLIDEVEKVSKKELSDLRAILLAGYKKGMTVPRTEEQTVGKIKIHTVEKYNVFSPKMMANISGMEDVLEDRCITLVVLRTMNKEIGNKVVSPEDAPEFQLQRNSLYLNMMLNWKKIREDYSYFKSVFTGKEKIKDEWLKGLIDRLLEKVYSRQLELWLPIYSLAYSISKETFEQMVNLSIDLVQEKQEIEETENVDLDILRGLCGIVDSNNWYKTADLTTRIKEMEDLDWLNSRFLGKFLSRVRIRKGSRSVGGRKQVFINLDNLKAVARRFGIDYDTVRTQTTIPEILNEKDSFLEAVDILDKLYGDSDFPREELLNLLITKGIHRIKANEMIDKAINSQTESLLISNARNGIIYLHKV